MLSGLIARIGMREAALGVVLLATAALLAALAFQYLGGYEPCALCYRQRWAYYFGIPLALLALVAARSKPGLAAGALGAVCLGFLINAGLGIHHSGVEWGWWPGPESCSGGIEVSENAAALLRSLSESQAVRCDEPAFRFIWLSFAGWNAVVSAGLAFIAALGVRLYTVRRSLVA